MSEVSAVVSGTELPEEAEVAQETEASKYGFKPGQCSIHPYGRRPGVSARKRANNLANHAARREVNSARANSVLNNPTWHGIGRHAGVPRGH
jgi:hypothetical protein